jgi:hypothetical protein
MNYIYKKLSNNAKKKEETIPILIICYNNYKYVQNTLNQINKINKKYYKDIQIVDNSSSCHDTIHFLKNIDVKVINNQNNGPWISDQANIHIYNMLPNKYILTDPDLEFNTNLPNNFIEILSKLSDKYKCNKVGFALDISDFDNMYITTYFNNLNIYDWEKQFWTNIIDDNIYDLYNADIDTTFCLVNKNYINDYNNIRVAGNFTAKHLPWYKNNKIYNIYENYLENKKTTKISTISTLIIPHIDANYIKVYKNDELFLINNKNPNIDFWINNYNKWNNLSFDIFDKYLNKNKIFINIGDCAYIIYGSRKSKLVYSINKSNNFINDILQTNCINNYKLIDDSNHNYSLIDIINYYKIDPNEIGLINMDINGSEENILNDLNSIYEKHKIPICIKIYYDLWNNKNLDRFNFITSIEKDKILKSSIIIFPFVS